VVVGKVFGQRVFASVPDVRTPMGVGFAQGQINRLINRGPTMNLDDLIGDVA